MNKAIIAAMLFFSVILMGATRTYVESFQGRSTSAAVLTKSDVTGTGLAASDVSAVSSTTGKLTWTSVVASGTLSVNTLNEVCNSAGQAIMLVVPAGAAGDEIALRKTCAGAVILDFDTASQSLNGLTAFWAALPLGVDVRIKRTATSWVGGTPMGVLYSTSLDFVLVSVQGVTTVTGGAVATWTAYSPGGASTIFTCTGTQRPVYVNSPYLGVLFDGADDNCAAADAARWNYTNSYMQALLLYPNSTALLDPQTIFTHQSGATGFHWTYGSVTPKKQTFQDSAGGIYTDTGPGGAVGMPQLLEVQRDSIVGATRLITNMLPNASDSAYNPIADVAVTAKVGNTASALNGYMYGLVVWNTTSPARLQESRNFLRLLLQD